jgi:hypothetical protein
LQHSTTKKKKTKKAGEASRPGALKYQGKMDGRFSNLQECQNFRKFYGDSYKQIYEHLIGIETNYSFFPKHVLFAI